jgi:hypothetical protein
MATPSSAEWPIQETTLELNRWFIPLLHRLPRQHRMAVRCLLLWKPCWPCSIPI